jgi:CDP-glycerol glycerophosphotransferase (TagB/SpsB family)
MLDQLLDTGWRVIVRPHPQSKKSEPDMLDALTKRYEGRPNLEWDWNRENIYSLSRADIMISDFSGIVFDYTFLMNKPVLYVLQEFDSRPYDADDIPHELWQFRAIKEFGIELKKEQFANIKEVIQNMADSAELAEARKKAGEEAWMYRGEAGKRIADFLINED